jgi:hypothetical protein
VIVDAQAQGVRGEDGLRYGLLKLIVGWACKGALKVIPLQVGLKGGGDSGSGRISSVLPHPPFDVTADDHGQRYTNEDEGN